MQELESTFFHLWFIDVDRLWRRSLALASSRKTRLVRVLLHRLVFENSIGAGGTEKTPWRFRARCAHEIAFAAEPLFRVFVAGAKYLCSPACGKIKISAAVHLRTPFVACAPADASRSTKIVCSSHGRHCGGLLKVPVEVPASFSICFCTTAAVSRGPRQRVPRARLQKSATEFALEPTPPAVLCVAPPPVCCLRSTAEFARQVASDIAVHVFYTCTLCHLQLHLLGLVLARRLQRRQRQLWLGHVAQAIANARKNRRKLIVDELEQLHKKDSQALTQRVRRGR